MKIPFHLPLGRIPFATCVISGILLALAFPKANIWPLAFFALAPLLIVSRGKGLKESFGAGYLFGLAYSSALLYWIVRVLVTYGHLDWAFSLGLFILFMCYLALYSGVFILGLRLSETRLGAVPGKLPWVFIGAVLFTGLEYARGWLLTGFPWEPLGAALIPCLPLIQISDVVGIGGLSFMTAVANMSLAAAVIRTRQTEPGGVIPPLVVFVLVVALLLGYGHFRLRQVDDIMAQGLQRKWAVVQGNVDQALKWDPDYRVATLVAYRDLSNAAAKNDPWMIVWPETAAPFFYMRDVSMRQWMEKMVGHLDRPLLFGAPAFMTEVDGDHYYNRAYLLDARGKMSSYYDKVHLVPFGEYVPLKKYFPFISKISQAAGNYESGDKARLLDWDGDKIGVLICYESVFPELARAHVKAGADWLVVMTNDAWFGRSSASYQHFAQSIGRAVETRRPVIRAANTGISGFIQPNGRVQADLDIFKQGVVTGTVVRPQINTVYTAVGDIIPKISFGITIFIFLAALIRRKINAGRSKASI